MDLDREKERELDELHSQVRKIEFEKKQLKERINEMNDDDYVERKLQLLYDQKREQKK